MLWIFLVLPITIVLSRPQNDQSSNVEIEKQDLIQLHPFDKKVTEHIESQRNIEQHTKDIMEKIEAVNRKHGLVKKKPSYFQFPFSYSTGTGFSRADESQKVAKQHREDFQFPLTPFTDPILDYIKPHDGDKPTQTEIVQPSQGFTVSTIVPNAEITKDDIIPGQYIKRKITHQQTYYMPISALESQGQHYQNPYAYSGYPNNFGQQYYPQPSFGQQSQGTNINNMERNTVNNVKNIVRQSQPNGAQKYNPTQAFPYNAAQSFPYNPSHSVPYNPQSGSYNPQLGSYNPQSVPYNSAQSTPYNPYYSGYNFLGQPNGQTSNTPNLNAITLINGQLVSPNFGYQNNDQSKTEQNPYSLYGPYVVPSLKSQKEATSRQNWNWPGSQYFPIVVRDPFLQVMNAFTTMVEYGPNAGIKPPGCRSDDISSRENKIIEPKSLLKNEQIITLDIKNGEAKPEVTISGQNAQNQTLLDIEDIEIKNAETNPQMKLMLNLSPGIVPTGREAKTRDNKVSKVTEAKDKEMTKISMAYPQASAVKQNNLHFIKPNSVSVSDEHIRSTTPVVYFPHLFPKKTTTQPPLPVRDQTPYDDEKDDDEDKAEDVNVSHDGNKKLFSKDNTGSGIFIHKLKVRKGGVAIAGPGGIATAGSGGTAIVGPNGYAYTHPDSLAIAGSGTKVVAVEPSVNLSDIINNSTGSLSNRNKYGGNNPRVGKVVAVGPVIYYNKGHPKITILPYYGGAKGQSLQITELSDGKLTTQIIETPSKLPEEEQINPYDLEHPQLPSKYDIDYEANVKNLGQFSNNILKLQETAKNRGTLTDREEKVYRQNVEELNQSAENLAKMQEQSADQLSLEGREGLSSWFERKRDTQQDKDKKKKNEKNKNKNKEDEEDSDDEDDKNKKNKKKPENNKKKEEEKEEPEEGVEENKEDTDSVAINLPPEDASVAEAKPVGLAIAGKGGVAAAKPVATAVVGPGGLAIARPVGTAIAGVDPHQALVPAYAEGYVGAIKPSRNGSKVATNNASEYLNKIISKYHQV